jgi:hypothetical protein
VVDTKLLVGIGMYFPSLSSKNTEKEGKKTRQMSQLGVVVQQYGPKRFFLWFCHPRLMDVPKQKKEQKKDRRCLYRTFYSDPTCNSTHVQHDHFDVKFFLLLLSPSLI